MPVSWRHRAEFGLLIALCVFLPLYEAPKNVAWVGYVALWLANRAIDRDFGGRWDPWDTLICAWLASGFVVAAFAGLHGGEWRAALDIVRYGGVLWLMKRTRFTERQIELVMAALVAAVVIGLAMAYARVAALDATQTGREIVRLELNSVGHVNHTAIYLAIMLAVCVSWLFTGRHRVVMSAASLLVLVSTFVAASRAGVGAGLLAIGVLAAFWWRRSRLPVAIAVALLLVTAAVNMLGGAEVFERHEAVVHSGNTLAFRDRAWNLAIATWQQYPLFGVGMDNFALVSRAQSGDRYSSLFPHAHSLYLNTLVERGLVGALPVALVLLAWAAALMRRLPRASDGDVDWLVWGAALGAWLVTAVAGLVNTTLHHEHGLLAMVLLGLWLARRAHQQR